ncbi:hypothetical protein AB0D38_45330 [Streptomyces sp. NPDC048279]|uniref:hypothetical protein n=1 Tax=Streptomyces sp. NPDC048279 TaxID=3154714 RepID=UPI00342DB73B
MLVQVRRRLDDGPRPVRAAEGLRDVDELVLRADDGQAPYAGSLDAGDQGPWEAVGTQYPEGPGVGTGGSARSVSSSSLCRWATIS